MKMKKGLGLGIGYLLVGIVASEFTRRSVTPEQVTSTWLAVPAFVVFILFVIAAFSLGALVRRQLKLVFFEGAENGFFDLSVGTVLFYLLAYALTPVHAFSSDLRVFLWVVLSALTGFGARFVEPRKWFSFANTIWAKLLLAVPLLIVFLRLIEGLQFHLHGDAYVTYLAAPRVWAATGSFADFLKFTQFFLATSWESTYAWGTALMGLMGGAGLDLSQYFGQWCNGGIALLGITLGTLALSARIAKIFSLSARWFPIAAVSAIQIPLLSWTANLGKHDMGVAFWGLAGFYFTLFLAPLSMPLAFLAGILTGAAVIGKLTVSILGICLGIHILVFYPKRTLVFSLGGILGGLPVFLRNYLITENPVFPWLANRFPHPERYLSRDMLGAALNATSHRFAFADLNLYLHEINSQLPLWPVLILMLIFIKNRKEYLKLVWVPLAALIGFTVVFRPSTEIRYQNANLVILGGMTCIFAFYLLSRLPRKWGTFACSLFAIAIVATANISTFTLFQIGSTKFNPISKTLASLTGGPGKLWIRQNLKSDVPIFSMSDPHVYYTLDYQITEISQSPMWDNKLSDTDAKGFAAELMNSDFKYVYISTEVPYWMKTKQGEAVKQELNAHNPSCKLFADAKNEIWNLDCLRITKTK